LSYLADNGDALRAATAVVVDDAASDYNARGRGIRSYELQAMVETVVGTKVTLGYFSYDYCNSQKPDLLMRITPTGGRTTGLVQRKAAVNVTIEPFFICK